jgi:tetratricopeptide (TPR) repeat protein
MHQYSVGDVERLVRLPRRRIRSLVEAGLVSPARGPRNTWLFSFQDLIVLRSARSLADAKVPHKRLKNTVEELKRRLPDAAPLSGVSLSADGDGLVVKEGDRRWQAESGQYLLGFHPEAETAAGAEGSAPAEDAEAHDVPVDATPRVLLRRMPTPPASADDWFERGAWIETQDQNAALEAYTHAIAADPGLLKARINLGCLLHDMGRLDQAERVYREALRAHGDDPVVLYDLGVLLEDQGRRREAMQVYETALRKDPRFADCHYNLALLYRSISRPKEAIQHMAAYRRLTSTTP